MTSDQHLQAPGFAAIESILFANGWASQAQIDRVKQFATDPRHLMRILSEQNILTPESITTLDGILHQQGQLPNFTILRKLGAGGMGTVYLAKHLASGGEVALKVISTRLADDSEFLSRFHRETKALVGLRHSHLCNVIESGTQGSTHYLAMEYVAGPSLSSLLKEYRALPEQYVLTLLRQLADCLGYVYGAAGLVHRDIKPENVLIQRTTSGTLFPLDDHAKLIDFGLVKSANDDEHLTQTGMTIGTPLYMSPEQVRGEKLDCRSDIYGLGASVYHLLTGSPPFRGSSPGAIMSAHLTDPVPDPGEAVPSLCAATRRLVMTAMVKDSGRRYLTFDAFIKACDEALEELREKSGSSIRLLRKPLIIAKKPTRKTGTDRVEHAADACLALPVISPGAPSAPSAPTTVGLPGSSALSDRIQRKHAERNKGDSQRIARAAPGPGEAKRRGDSQRLVRTAAADARASGAELRAPSPMANRVNDGGPPTSGERLGVKPAAASARLQPVGDSAVFSEDPAGTRGTGIIPWIILAGAIVIALAIAWYTVASG
jgi:serine/threonine protein kinase